MLNYILKQAFGSRNERLLKTMRKTITIINELEPAWQELTDIELKAKTQQFKQRYNDGENLDSLIPEAFTTVREASVRTLGQRHYDVQLIGAMALHQGKIAEMGTGEGKTLMSTLTAYLNAITGKGVHIITVNSYLAQRDAAWMGKIFNFLDLSVGVIVPDLSQTERRLAYNADITYGTNNEFGFDYLRDNMAVSQDTKVQRGLSFAIIDEVDSILIDEARTPLIISGPIEENPAIYQTIHSITKSLKASTQTETPNGDFTLNEKERQVSLTEQGHHNIEEKLLTQGLLTENTSLYDIQNIKLMHYINACLRANFMYKKDIEYIVQNGQIIIIDEHTGRAMPGRRWSEGLHQAIEAKESVEINSENQTLASITFQNLFRLYNKLSGMTGTADTEAYELQHIYNLEVVIIPTNKPMIRNDIPDQVYLTSKVKYDMIIKNIVTRHKNNQPILVGTASIENSEHVSQLLTKQKIKHQVLNAKQHEKEASIIADAGCSGAVTIATNMAGRGTDIVLGGNLDSQLAAIDPNDSNAIKTAKQNWQKQHQQVIEAGGLHVLGTERNESRRIDNQLRGRSGRQGDPGSSQYYLSLEDNLMRIFAPAKLSGMMRALGMKEEENMQAKMLCNAIESAQRKVEGHHFDIRKELLKYDDVANEQRKIIYQQRNELLSLDDISDNIIAMRETVISKLVDKYLPNESLADDWNPTILETDLKKDFAFETPISTWLEKESQITTKDIQNRIIEHLVKQHQNKEDNASPEIMRQFEKALVLQILDTYWKEHLAAMDHLRQGIHFRGYAQKNPVHEYKREAFELFNQMLEQIKYQTISKLSTVIINIEPADEPMGGSISSNYSQAKPTKPTAFQYTMAMNADSKQTGDIATLVKEEDQQKVGRNNPCPCGSGKKYKQCHGKSE